MVYKIDVKPLPPDHGILCTLWEVWEVHQHQDNSGFVTDYKTSKLTSGIVRAYKGEPYSVATPGHDPDDSSNEIWMSSEGPIRKIGHWVLKPDIEVYDLLVKEAKERAETFVDTLLAHSVVYEYPRLEQVIEPVFNTN